MPGRAKKSTKKFEKNHLKDTIDRRKDFAKIKQRQQIKAKKQARHKSDYAKASEDEEEKKAPISNGRGSGKVDTLKDMTVDDFFQGGFEIPELQKSQKVSKTKTALLVPSKRKRDPDRAEVEEKDSHSDSDDPASVDVGLSDEDSGSGAGEETAGHKGDLDALAQKDPEFYRYLKDNDAELLDFAETDDLQLAEELSDGGELPKKKRKKMDNVEVDGMEEDDGTEVTLATIDKWRTAMAEQHSLRAMRQVVLAFRAAAHVNEEDGKEYKYSVSSPDVYHQLLVIALQHVPDVLTHHLPVKELASGRVRVATESKKYQTLTPLLKSHAASVHHLLENLSDAPTIKLTLASILPLLPYLLSFKKALKNLVKAIVNIWSDASSAEATRINAFLLIRRLTVISDPSLREAVLKTVYQGLIKGSRNTTIHTSPGINLMKNSAADLWGIDAQTGYTTAFTYIRQLAIHLRTTITHPTKDSYKAIYNWQYTHSLDFWSRVLATHCPSSSSPFHPLIYPLVQISLGALRLIPTPTYFPLRFHLTRSLLRISRSTTTYIPLAPALLEILSSPELKKSPKPSTLPPLDFRIALRAPKSYLRTRVYQNGIAEQVSELLAEFFGVWAQNIAFPELIIPPSVLLKRWLKDISSQVHSHPDTRKPQSSKGNRNARLAATFNLLLSKLAANASLVEERRRKIDFAISDRKGVEGFLKDVQWEDMPLGAYVVGLRRGREEREKLLEEARKDDDARRNAKGEEEEEDGDEDVLNADDDGSDDDDDDN